MLKLSFVTIHPGIFAAYQGFGVFAAALRAKKACFELINLRQFANDRHGSIDARPYGGGDGMVMRPDCLAAALRGRPSDAVVVAPSPRGELWTHAQALQLSRSKRPLIFVCGRFGGIDERFYTRYVDCEYSLGHFVLSGGELAALTMVDSMLRLIPGVLGNARSATDDSFAEGSQGGLEHPLYTKPQVFEGLEVPEVLRSGDHKKIADWRLMASQLLTAERRRSGANG